MTRRIALLGLLAFASAAAPAIPSTPPASSGEGWIRLDTPNLTIFSNAPAERTLDVGRNLERFRHLLATLATDLHIHSPLPTTIYVFRDEDAFRPYKPRRPVSPGTPLSLAGYFVKHRDGNYIGINAGAQDDPWPIVYHEYFHYFLNNNFSDIPLWFGEGIAEAFSTVRFKEGAVSIGRPIGPHLRWLRSHPLIPLKELFAIDTSSRDYNEGARLGTFYAESWALVHYLMWGRPGASDTGVRFLRDLKRGGSLADALRPLLGDDPGALQERLSVYMMEWLPRSELEHASPDLADIGRVAAIGRDEALYRLGDYLLHTEPAHAEAAAAHLTEALRLNPRHARAHAALAQVRSQQGRHDEAFAGFETALRIAPADDWTSLLYAHALLEKAFPEGISRHALTDEPPAQLARARELFQRSTKSNPDIGEAWAGLGLACVLGRSDLAIGIEALEKARRLLPAREDVVVNLATLYARSGDRDRARELVGRILLRSADPAMRAAGNEVLFRGDMEAAAALIQAGKPEEGIGLMKSLRDRTPDPALRSEVEGQLRGLEKTSATNREIVLYNAAVERANRQDVEGAIADLERLVPGLSEPKVRQDATALLVKLRQIALYNRAVKKVNSGDLRGASDLLKQILHDPYDPEMAKRTRELLADIDKRGRPGS